MSRRANDVTVVPVRSPLESASPPLSSDETFQGRNITFPASSSIGWNIAYVFKMLLQGWFRRMICEELSLGFRWSWAASSSCSRGEPVVVVEDHSVETPPFPIGEAATGATADYTVFDRMELLSAHLCWLRGVIAYISVLVYLLGFLFSSSPMWTLSFRILIFLLSEAVCVFICKSYLVRLQLEATTDSLFRNMHLLSSPFLPIMILEVLFWNLITPPMLFSSESPVSIGLGFLNYLLFTRLYAVVVYYWHVSCGFRPFGRFLALLGSQRQMGLGTRFFLSTTMIYRRRLLLPLLSFFWWITIGLLSCKAEKELSIFDGLWVSFQTLSTLSYGDFSPTSVHGKWLMWIAWLGNALLWGYLGVVVVIMPAMSELQSHQTESTSAAKVEVLSACYILSKSVRERSACVIQAAWRLHMAKKTLREEGRIQWRRGGSGERSTEWNLHLPALLKRGKNSLVSIVLTWKLVFLLLLLRRDRHALYQTSEKLVDSAETRFSEEKRKKTTSKKSISTHSDKRNTGKRKTDENCTAGVSLPVAIQRVRLALGTHSVGVAKSEMFEELAQELLILEKSTEKQTTLSNHCTSPASVRLNSSELSQSVEDRIARIESKNAELTLLVQRMLYPRNREEIA